MILTNFRLLIRMYVPSAKVNVINNVKLDLLINKGVDDVNEEAGAYKGDTTFNVVTEKQTYSISTEIPDFVMMDKGGLWWNDGTASTPNWQRLDGMFRDSLDGQYPLWRDDDSSDPLRYILENDVLTIHPKPDTSLSDGFWAYYIKKAVPMTQGTHYPFTGSTSELTALSVLDDAIIDYVRWKLAEPLGSERKGIITEQDYRNNLVRKVDLLSTRFDVSATPGIRMRGTTIG